MSLRGSDKYEINIDALTFDENGQIILKETENIKAIDDWLSGKISSGELKEKIQ